VAGVEYRRPSVDSTKKMMYNQMKLMNNINVRIMFSIFNQYSTKGHNELEASLVRSFEDIQKSLIRLKNYEEIKALMEEPNEEISLVDM